MLDSSGREVSGAVFSSGPGYHTHYSLPRVKVSCEVRSCKSCSFPKQWSDSDIPFDSLLTTNLPPCSLA